MAKFTQDDRMISIDTPLGKHALLLTGFNGTESISRLFEFRLHLVSENHSVSFEAFIGKTEEWPVLPLALCGGRSESAFSLDRLLERSGPDVLMGVGLLGDVAGIRKLMEAPGDPESVEFASISLNLVIGAELYQEIFIPEEMDTDALFDDEIEKLEQGENLYPSDEEPGTTLLVPVWDQNAWIQ